MEHGCFTAFSTSSGMGKTVGRAVGANNGTNHHSINQLVAGAILLGLKYQKVKQRVPFQHHKVNGN